MGASPQVCYYRTPVAFLNPCSTAVSLLFYPQHLKAPPLSPGRGGGFALAG